MARRRADRALISIVAVVATTMLLAACNRAESTPATFDFQPVSTTSGSAATTAAPRSTTTMTVAASTTTVLPVTTTTEAPTTTGTFRVVSNAAPSTSSATTVTTTVAPTTTTVAAPTTTVAASQGWITVLASLSTANYTRAEAAAWRVELGIANAELLLSNDYSSLTPGYWVLYRGPYGDRSAAAGVCDSYGDLVPGCYPAPLTLAG